MYVVVNTRRGRPARVTVSRIPSRNFLRSRQLDKRAQKVDRVGAIELAPQVLKQLVALGIHDQALRYGAIQRGRSAGRAGSRRLQ